jgi:exopolysaccharide biosynthesis protein
MSQLRLRFLTLCLVSAAVLPAAASTVKVNNWRPAFIGIDETTATIDGQDASVAYALRIDLQAPGIRFYSTPHQGTAQTVASTDSQFLVKYGLQAVINANFFAPCCNATPEPKTFSGVAVSDANVVGLPVSAVGQNAALLITRKNGASIVETTEQTDLTDVFTAVTGSGIIVSEGQNVGSSTSGMQGDGADPNPRSLLGLSKDSRYLYIVAVDGRQPGYSAGTTSVESADIMLQLGAFTALNLDGGGSTSLVKDNGNGGATVINRPSGGTERFDANQLGVRAVPLPKVLSISGILEDFYNAFLNY